LDVTATHAGADGSSHAITSQLTLSYGNQSPVSNAYTVTIGDDSGVPTDGQPDDGYQNNIGGDGADNFIGSTGNDTFNGGLGADTYMASEGNDTINTGDAAVDTFELHDFELEYVNLVGNDLLFTYERPGVYGGILHTANIIDHADGYALGNLRLDFNKDGALETYTVATIFDNSENTTGNLVIAGTDFDDTAANSRDIKGGIGNDLIFGNAGADEINGGAGDDWIEGGEGVDAISGGVHATEGDLISFHSATEGVVIDLSASTISNDGYGNAETVSGIENIHGSEQDDVLSGDAGVNFLFGSDGDDTLIGGGGDDTLYGGAGVDQLYGGSGSDVFEFRSVDDSAVGEASRDIIFDFDSGTDTTSVDTIDLTGLVTSDFLFMDSAPFTTDSSVSQVRVDRSAATSLIEIDLDSDAQADAQIELAGNDGVGLNQDDFVVG
jgi:Ca2+-binding RTX toxin-like protein